MTGPRMRAFIKAPYGSTGKEKKPKHHKLLKQIEAPVSKGGATQEERV